MRYLLLLLVVPLMGQAALPGGGGGGLASIPQTIQLSRIELNETALGNQDATVTTTDQLVDTYGVNLNLTSGDGLQGGYINIYTGDSLAIGTSGGEILMTTAGGGPSDPDNDTSGGAGGVITFRSGAGGESVPNGYPPEGGAFYFISGNGGAAFRQGAEGGAGGIFEGTGGVGGVALDMPAGQGGTFTFAGGTGGTIPLNGGGGTAKGGKGGNLQLSGGAGGDVSTAQLGDAGGGDGGDVTLQGGDASAGLGAGADGVAGNVYIRPGFDGDGTSPGQVFFNYGLSVSTTSAAPTCDATRRGAVWVVQGDTGVTDTLQVCLKAAADTYSWRSIVTGG